MSDRTPPEGQPPAEGTPEYDWLYGKRPPSERTSERPTAPPQPDATRLMPTTPASPTPANQRPHQTPPPPPPPRTAQPGATSGRRLPKFRPRWLLYLLILWLVYILAVPIWAWVKVPKVDAWPDGERPADQPGTTYLVVGSDARKGLAGQRTDTIMLMHTGSGPNVLMSIPRDSLVDVPGHGTTKINAAFAYGGPKLLVKTIEKDTGIRIDDYIEVGFTGFVDVVDAVGGIEICPKENMKDKLAHLNIKKGCQEVNGKTALAYSRSRHVSSLGDIDRARNQREVVAAIGHKALSPWTVLNPVRWWRVNFGVAESVQISEGTGPLALAKFGWAMTHMGDALTCGVPISDLAVHWDPQRSKQMFEHIINDDTENIGKLCTPSGLPKSVTG